MPHFLGGPELFFILLIVLIVFGAGKLPSVMRDFGKGVKEFKKAQSEEEEAAMRAASTQTSASAAAPTTSATTVTTPTNGAATAGARPTEPATRA